MTIWKYTLTVQDYSEIEVPKDATFLCVQTQFNNPQIWLLVNPNQPEKEIWRLRLAGTGHTIKDSEFPLKYLGTFQLLNGRFIGHLFKKVNP